MSGSLSATTRFEDQFGPVTPGVTRAHEWSKSTAPLGATDTSRLHDLVEQMHGAVVHATMAADLEAKIESWAAYRASRAQALAMLPSAPEPPSPPRLRSV
jgi:hypothetical protein